MSKPLLVFRIRGVAVTGVRIYILKPAPGEPHGSRLARIIAIGIEYAKAYLVAYQLRSWASWIA